jgi:aryl-alcohol dehydrogenase-like predicted oxidoreductase
MHKEIQFGRRKFLKTAVIGMVGGSLAANAGWAGNRETAGKYGQETKDISSLKIKSYRILGRTGFKVSDLGVGQVQDEGLMSAMLDAGMNYIDTAESYPGHHRIVGKVIKGRDRKSIFVTSKMLMEGDISKEGLLKRVYKALEELDTEYIDCMMMHLPNNLETLNAESFHAAMAQLKSEGKIRHVGASHHGSFWFKDPEETMEKILLAAASFTAAMPAACASLNARTAFQ